jgi:predicted Na+-dependent transporter
MNYIALSITGAVALLMLYTGMSFNLSAFKAYINRKYIKEISTLSLVNFIVIPAFAFAIYAYQPEFLNLGIAILILSALPCAPLVPSIISMTKEPYEWSVLVFIIYSFMSLVIIILLTIYFSKTGYSHNQEINNSHNMYKQLIGYLFSVFLPLVIGALFRYYWENASQLAIRIIRPLSSISVLVATSMFIFVNVDKIKIISLHEILVLIMFNFICIGLAFISGIHHRETLLTRILTTGFRNIALAIPFSLLVLGNPQVSIFILIYALVAMVTCLASVVMVRGIEKR